MSSLDDLITRARELEVRPEHARAYVDELGRWARRGAEPRRRWVPWLAGGVAVAAAAAVIVVLIGRGPTAVTAATAPVAIGERVAIVPEPDAAYRLEAVDRDTTTIAVEHGTVTARLFPGDRPHRLTLRGADVRATATGTIYSLTVDDRGATVSVHEGKVLVRRGAETALVAAGSQWPADRPRRGEHAARQLATTAALPVEPPALVPDAMPLDAGAVAIPDAVVRDARDAAPAIDAAPAPDLRDRWRQARLLRGQGKPEAALAECLAIADARDATWSPIALVEAIRIALGPLASPERALELSDRFVRAWPAHELAPEARELRCRAAKQLGRTCPTAP